MFKVGESSSITLQPLTDQLAHIIRGSGWSMGNAIMLGKARRRLESFGNAIEVTDLESKTDICSEVDGLKDLSERVEFEWLESGPVRFIVSASIYNTLSSYLKRLRKIATQYDELSIIDWALVRLHVRDAPPDDREAEDIRLIVVTFQDIHDELHGELDPQPKQLLFEVQTMEENIKRINKLTKQELTGLEAWKYRMFGGSKDIYWLATQLEFLEQY